MLQSKDIKEIERVPSGIEGFDHILRGGYPKGRSLLLVGSSGSGKTLLSLQSLYTQISQFHRKCVFVTFEERPDDILTNTDSLGFHLRAYLDERAFFFIDASPDVAMFGETGEFNLSGLLAQLRGLIDKHGVSFVVLDSLGGLFFQYRDKSIVRRELFLIVEELRKLGITSIITAERLDEYGGVSRFGVEEYVTDGVVILRHILADEKLRRTVQVYKLRGCNHHQGEFALTISETGVGITPLSMMELTQSSSLERVSFGDQTFDEMCGGGLFNDSVMLISGPTGAGKTLLCSTFMSGGCSRQERCLFLGFEESKPQLIRNARSWGYPFDQWEKEGLLRIECIYPEYQGLEEHLVRIRRMIDEFKPRRLVIDSVSALERIGSVRVFREFVIGLTALVKQRNICSVFISTSPALSGGDSITDTHISTITDIIVILRYIEHNLTLSRGLMVIKMRGSSHEKEFREFTISNTGIQIGERPKIEHNVLFRGEQV